MFRKGFFLPVSAGASLGLTLLRTSRSSAFLALSKAFCSGFICLEFKLVIVSIVASKSATSNEILSSAVFKSAGVISDVSLGAAFSSSFLGGCDLVAASAAASRSCCLAVCTSGLTLSGRVSYSY